MADHNPAFCELEDVNQRLARIVGKGFSSDDVEERITRAESTVKSRLMSAYGTGEIATWVDVDSTPDVIKNLTADFAALYVKQDFIKDYKETPAEREQTYKLLDKLVEGFAEIFDSDGNVISRSGGGVQTNTGSKTNIFTMGNEGEGSLGSGTLDDYGPDQGDIEGSLTN